MCARLDQRARSGQAGRGAQLLPAISGRCACCGAAAGRLPARSPVLLGRTNAWKHVRPFAQTLTERQGERLPRWLDAVRQDDLPSLHTLAAGLTLPWNSGVVEGHVNRIKMLKRQMFGRAGFHLLRKRVLLA